MALRSISLARRSFLSLSSTHQLVFRSNFVPLRFAGSSHHDDHQTGGHGESHGHGHHDSPGTKVEGTKHQGGSGNPYYGDPFLPREEVARRIITVVKNFDKVANPDNVTETSHFVKDLGLDSLDVVELVLQIEDEFVLDIPDDDVEQIHTVADAIEYVSHHPASR